MEIFSPKYGGHVAITQTASKAVAAGNLLKQSGSNAVEPATAGSIYIGTAGHDAQENDLVAVHYQGVFPLVAAQAIVAGDVVKTGASGKVAKATAANEAGVFGVAMTDAAANKTVLVRIR